MFCALVRTIPQDFVRLVGCALGGSGCTKNLLTLVELRTAKVAIFGGELSMLDDSKLKSQSASLSELQQLSSFSSQATLLEIYLPLLVGL